MRKMSKKMRKATAKANGKLVQYKKLKKVNQDTITPTKLLSQQEQLVQNLEANGDIAGAELVQTLIKKSSSVKVKQDNKILEHISKQNAIIISKLNEPKEVEDKQDTEIHTNQIQDLLNRITALENKESETEKENKESEESNFLSKLLSSAGALLAFGKTLFSGDVFNTLVKPVLLKLVKLSINSILESSKIISTLALKMSNYLATSGIELIKPVFTKLIPKLLSGVGGPISAIIAGTIGIYELLTFAAKNSGYNSMEDAFGSLTRDALINLGMDKELVQSFKDKGFAQAMSEHFFGVKPKDLDKLEKAKTKIKLKGKSAIESSLEEAGIIEFSNFPKYAGFMSYIKVRSSIKELDTKTIKYLIANYNWVSTDKSILISALKYSTNRAKYTDKEWAELESKRKEKLRIHQELETKRKKNLKQMKTVERLLINGDKYQDLKQQQNSVKSQLIYMQKNKLTKEPEYLILVKKSISLNNQIKSRKEEFKNLKSTQALIEQEESTPGSVIRKNVIKSVTTGIESGNVSNKTTTDKGIADLKSVANIGANVNIKDLDSNFVNNLIGLAEEFALETPGKKIGIVSAFRSKEYQKKLWDEKYKQLASKHPDWSEEQLKNETRKWVAIPGRSMHNAGVAVDLDSYSKKAVTDKLLKKYNMHRAMVKINPKETWHIEPLGINRKAIADKGEIDVTPKESIFKKSLRSFGNMFSGAFRGESELDIEVKKELRKKELRKKELYSVNDSVNKVSNSVNNSVNKVSNSVITKNINVNRKKVAIKITENKINKLNTLIKKYNTELKSVKSDTRREELIQLINNENIKLLNFKSELKELKSMKLSEFHNRAIYTNKQYIGIKKVKNTNRVNTNVNTNKVQNNVVNKSLFNNSTNNSTNTLNEITINEGNNSSNVVTNKVYNKNIVKPVSYKDNRVKIANQVSSKLVKTSKSVNIVNTVQPAESKNIIINTESNVNATLSDAFSNTSIQ